MDERREDVLAYLAVLHSHVRQAWSWHPRGRVNREVGRRTDDVGLSPNEGALIRFARAVVAEQRDEWQGARVYFTAQFTALLEEPRAVLTTPMLAAS